MPRLRTLSRIAASVLISVLLVLFSALVAGFGGFLNHCRGGYISLMPGNAKVGSHEYDEWYWPQHIFPRLLLAFPTGLLVLICGLHLRASVVVALLTWFSLYAGWETYNMNIGTVDNYCSHAGLFDWLLGNWTNQSFIREYSGMSLRGLMWTLPQGYALEQMGFGWEYSLTGVLMPLVYYIGNNSHVHPRAPHAKKVFMDSHLATSEFLWGSWIWFVLIQVCLAQLVRRARIWIYKRNPHLGFRPFSVIEKIKYESLNRAILRGFYETLVIIVTLLYCFTAVYYSVIEQSDVRNKGQNFFGLFTAIVFQIVFLSWMWGVRYRNFILKRYARKLRGRTTTNNAIYNGGGSSNSSSARQSVCEEEGPDTPEMAQAASVSTLTSGIDHYDALSQSIHTSPSFETPPSHSARNQKEKKPLLSWPYSHPDRLSPTEEQRQQVLDISGAGHRTYSTLAYSRFSIYWKKLESYVWLDIFIVMRRTIGLLTLIGTIFSLMMTVTASILGRDNARFTDDLDPPCRNTTFSF